MYMFRCKGTVVLVLLLVLFTLTPFLTTWNMMVSNNNIKSGDDDSLLVAPLRNNKPPPRVFALMTEPRCVPAVPYVLKNALERLPESFPVVLFHSHDNKACIHEWIYGNETTPSGENNNNSSVLLNAVETGRLVLSTRFGDVMDPHARDVYSPSNWNNVLYRNVSFWESLYEFGDTVLTFQTDTLICSNMSNNDSYVPPWHVNYLGGIASPTKGKPPSHDANHFDLNGGFSIRGLDWVIQCLRSSDSHMHNIVEDAVFNNCSHGKDSVSVLDAMLFASDFGYTKCFDWNGTRQCPWGIHKPWMYTHGNYVELIRYCPEIVKLHNLVLYAKHSKTSGK